jgi:hypothetical protein
MRSVALLGLLASVLAFAQSPSQTTAPDGKIRTRIEGITIPSIANAPFTARILVTWDEPLSDGGTVSHKYYTRVARDSKGRVRREVREFIPMNSNAKPPLRSFTIIDPTLGVRTVCKRATMKCTVTDFHPRATLTDTAIDQPSGDSNSVGRESLGQRNMNSMTVVGTRETNSTAAGTHGSDRVLVSSVDHWYSPDLQMDLSVTRNDPQFGQQTLTVADLVRGEPDSKWFAVPNGYQVIDASSHSPVNK